MLKIAIFLAFLAISMVIGQPSDYPINPASAYIDNFKPLNNERVEVVDMTTENFGSGVLDFQNLDNEEAVDINLSGGLRFNSDVISFGNSETSGSTTISASLNDVTFNANEGAINLNAGEDVDIFSFQTDTHIGSQDGGVNLSANNGEIALDSSELIIDGRHDAVWVDSSRDVYFDGDDDEGRIELTGRTVHFDSQSMVNIQALNDTLQVNVGRDMNVDSEVTTINADNDLEIKVDFGDIYTDVNSIDIQAVDSDVLMVGANGVNIRSFLGQIRVNTEFSNLDSEDIVTARAYGGDLDIVGTNTVDMTAGDHITVRGIDLEYVSNRDFIVSATEQINFDSAETVTMQGGTTEFLTDSVHISANEEVRGINVLGSTTITANTEHIEVDAEEMISLESKGSSITFSGNDMYIDSSSLRDRFEFEGSSIQGTPDFFEVNSGGDIEITTDTGDLLFGAGDLRFTGFNQINLGYETLFNVNSDQEINVNSGNDINVQAFDQYSVVANNMINIASQDSTTFSAGNDLNINTNGQDIEVNFSEGLNIHGTETVNFSSADEINMQTNTIEYFSANDIDIQSTNGLNIQALDEINLSTADTMDISGSTVDVNSNANIVISSLAAGDLDDDNSEVDISGIRVSYSTGTLNPVIPVNAQVSPIVNTLDVESNNLVNSLRVDMDLTHTFLGDLTITIRSPAGTTAQLMNSQCGGADDYLGTFADGGGDPCLDENPAAPVDSLSIFDGEPVQGTWSLEFIDACCNDDGDLLQWGISNIEPATETFSSGVFDPVLPINFQNSPQISTIDIVSEDLAHNIQVGINFQHDFVGDLIMTLTSPSGTDIELLNQECGSLGTTVETTFASTGSSLCDLNSFTQSAQPLSFLNGEPMEGTWTLTVEDVCCSDDGDLFEWSIINGEEPSVGTTSGITINSNSASIEGFGGNIYSSIRNTYSSTQGDVDFVSSGSLIDIHSRNGVNLFSSDGNIDFDASTQFTIEALTDNGGNINSFSQNDMIIKAGTNMFSDSERFEIYSGNDLRFDFSSLRIQTSNRDSFPIDFLNEQDFDVDGEEIDINMYARTGDFFNSVTTSTPGIPVNNNVSPIQDTLVVVENGIINDIRVGFSLTHQFLGDLIISITSPTGTTVTLFDQDCAAGDNISEIFSDDGGDICADANPAAPEEPLSTFHGEMMQGTWTLDIIDVCCGDDGQLDSWNVDIDYRIDSSINISGDSVLFRTMIDDAEPFLTNSLFTIEGSESVSMSAGTFFTMTTTEGGDIVANSDNDMKMTSSFAFQVVSGTNIGDTSDGNIYGDIIDSFTVTSGTELTLDADNDIFVETYKDDMNINTPGIMSFQGNNLQFVGRENIKYNSNSNIDISTLSGQDIYMIANGGGFQNNAGTDVKVSSGFILDVSAVNNKDFNYFIDNGPIAVTTGFSLTLSGGNTMITTNTNDYDILLDSNGGIFGSTKDQDINLYSSKNMFYDYGVNHDYTSNGDLAVYAYGNDNVNTNICFETRSPGAQNAIASFEGTSGINIRSRTDKTLFYSNEIDMSSNDGSINFSTFGHSLDPNNTVSTEVGIFMYTKESDISLNSQAAGMHFQSFENTNIQSYLDWTLSALSSITVESLNYGGKGSFITEDGSIIINDLNNDARDNEFFLTAGTNSIRANLLLDTTEDFIAETLTGDIIIHQYAANSNFDDPDNPLDVNPGQRGVEILSDYGDIDISSGNDLSFDTTEGNGNISFESLNGDVTFTSPNLIIKSEEGKVKFEGEEGISFSSTNGVINVDATERGRTSIVFDTTDGTDDFTIQGVAGIVSVVSDLGEINFELEEALEMDSSDSIEFQSNCISLIGGGAVEFNSNNNFFIQSDDDSSAVYFDALVDVVIDADSAFRVSQNIQSPIVNINAGSDGVDNGFQVNSFGDILIQSTSNDINNSADIIDFNFGNTNTMTATNIELLSTGTNAGFGDNILLQSAAKITFDSENKIDFSSSILSKYSTNEDILFTVNLDNTADFIMEAGNKISYFSDTSTVTATNSISVTTRDVLYTLDQNLDFILTDAGNFDVTAENTLSVNAPDGFSFTTAGVSSINFETEGVDSDLRFVLDTLKNPLGMNFDGFSIFNFKSSNDNIDIDGVSSVGFTMVNDINVGINSGININAENQISFTSQQNILTQAGSDLIFDVNNAITFSSDVYDLDAAETGYWNFGDLSVSAIDTATHQSTSFEVDVLHDISFSVNTLLDIDSPDTVKFISSGLNEQTKSSISDNSKLQDGISMTGSTFNFLNHDFFSVLSSRDISLTNNNNPVSFTSTTGAINILSRGSEGNFLSADNLALTATTFTSIFSDQGNDFVSNILTATATDINIHSKHLDSSIFFKGDNNLIVQLTGDLNVNSFGYQSSGSRSRFDNEISFKTDNDISITTQNFNIELTDLEFNANTLLDMNFNGASPTFGLDTSASFKSKTLVDIDATADINFINSNGDIHTNSEGVITYSAVNINAEVTDEFTTSSGGVITLSSLALNLEANTDIIFNSQLNDIIVTATTSLSYSGDNIQFLAPNPGASINFSAQTNFNFNGASPIFNINSARDLYFSEFSISSTASSSFFAKGSMYMDTDDDADTTFQAASISIQLSHDDIIPNLWNHDVFMYGQAVTLISQTTSTFLAQGNLGNIGRPILNTTSVPTVSSGNVYNVNAFEFFLISEFDDDNAEFLISATDTLTFDNQDKSSNSSIEITSHLNEVSYEQTRLGFFGATPVTRQIVNTNTAITDHCASGGCTPNVGAGFLSCQIFCPNISNSINFVIDTLRIYGLMQ